MKNYVTSIDANIIINDISKQIESGLSDKEVYQNLNERNILNLAKKDGKWTKWDVTNIRQTFNLDGEQKVIKDVVVKVYQGSSIQANQKFKSDLDEMAKNNYFPVNQSWEPGTYSTGAFIIALLLCLVLIGILIFIYMLIVKPAGQLHVTYEYRRSEVLETKSVKVCTKCAETIKEQAVVCRYCGHSYN